jgi:hypothetical protein
MEFASKAMIEGNQVLWVKLFESSKQNDASLCTAFGNAAQDEAKWTTNDSSSAYIYNSSM